MRVECWINMNYNVLCFSIKWIVYMFAFPSSLFSSIFMTGQLTATDRTILIN